jgi:quinol monooxygenase YgiN
MPPDGGPGSSFSDNSYEAGTIMWAQIIKTRVKTGMDDRVAELLEQLRNAEQPDSGLLRTTAMRDQKDPSQLYLVVVFESEEKARARELDPRRTEGLQVAQATMAEILDGPPDFVDLTIVEETTW